MSEASQRASVNHFLEAGNEDELQNLINTIVKRCNALLPTIGTHASGTNLRPTLYLLSTPNGIPAVEVVDVGEYMRDPHTKDMLTVKAQELIRKTGAEMAILAAESWGLDPSAPEEEQNLVMSGRKSVSQSEYKKTILSLHVQARGHRHEMAVYRYDSDVRLFETEPAFSSIREEEANIQTRWDFFAPTIEEMMDDCDPDGPVDGNLRGL